MDILLAVIILLVFAYLAAQLFKKPAYEVGVERAETDVVIFCKIEGQYYPAKLTYEQQQEILDILKSMNGGTVHVTNNPINL